MATDKQINFIDRLCSELGFNTLAKRNDYLTNRVNRKVVHTDQLTVPEASDIIDDLLARKENNNKPVRDDREEPEDE